MVQERKAGQEMKYKAGTVKPPRSADAITTGSAPPAKFNRHLYLNFLTNLETQVEYWNRSAVRSPNPETAHALWLKAEGLGYALRLLYAFEPEFRELVECAARSEGLNLTIPTSQNLERKSV